MANDGPTHLLALKVMRVSRPELATAWQPFYSSSPSFSAHSSAAILSLQGSAPLPGHPKTLRDLTHATELLTLPSAFGSIQLGETFSSCLCVNNEVLSEVELKQMKVEMQTATTKVTLSELDGSGPPRMLTVGDSMETIVHHEIKELGQHVLACTVTYRLPASARTIPGAAEHANDPSLLTFRKFYKFAITNPLSVKTKVHTAKSPSACLLLEERDKMFLEVHIQNLTPAAMFFEQMRFQCADGWDVDDINETGSTFTGSFAMMQPQDTRQYIYILSPKSTSLAPPTPVPGSTISLGRLDISWRSGFGEPGRLLTSMLTRRIPLLTVQQPVSAVPPYLKRTISGQTPSRPHSPQSFQARPTSPPPSQRPGSPFGSRPPSVSQIVRPQSPQAASAASHAQISNIPSDVEANLILRQIPRADIAIEQPFTATFALVVTRNPELGPRKLGFVIQHVRPSKVTAQPPIPSEVASPRPPSSGFATPVSAAPPFNYAVAHQKILDAALTKSPVTETLVGDDNYAKQFPLLPPPYFEGNDYMKAASPDVIPTGASAIFLPQFNLSSADEGTPSNPLTQEFQITFVPMKRGFATIGGIRILLIEDLSEVDGEEHRWRPNRVQNLKEYDIVGEVWVA